jgi:hypothetical protein
MASNRHGAITADAILKWLPLLLTLVTVVAMFVAVQTRLEALECKVQEQAVRVEKQAESNTEILVRLGRIETDLGYIRLELERQDN